MRIFVTLAIIAIGCAPEPPISQQPKEQFIRPLISDQLPYGFEREKVRAWHDRNDWCRRRTWPTTDEFVVCRRNPYLNPSTPPMYTLVKYDAADRAIEFAVFTPVPCRMYGRCDRVFPGTVYAAEHDFVDHSTGLRDDPASIGRSAEPHATELPDMQQRMFDALDVELERRFGPPVWRDPHRYGMTWATQTSEIGLFVAGN